jgi:hypothetical protein
MKRCRTKALETSLGPHQEKKVKILSKTPTGFQIEKKFKV